MDRGLIEPWDVVDHQKYSVNITILLAVSFWHARKYIDRRASKWIEAYL